jgi:SAM-dependent methyltransferase
MPRDIKRAVDWIAELFSPRIKRRHALERRQRRENHPERLALLPYCQTGKGIDVGCGHRKTHPNCIGIDIVAPGEKGAVGCVAGKRSAADIQACGDDLRMFADGELDFVISRHNLEHYVDVFKTLREWKRVLRIGGTLGMIVPDDRHIDSIALDPSHKHAFTPESLRAYLELVGGLDIIKIEPVIERWSFMALCRKTS